MDFRDIMRGAVIALLSLGSASAGEDEDSAKQNNLRGDHAGAVAIYRSLADQGKPEALVYLGLIHAAGKGVTRNPTLACDYYEQAARKNHPPALHLVGDCYFHGDGRPRDYAQSRVWYERAEEAGDVKAHCALGNQYMRGLGVPRDLERGMALCRKGAEAGDADAQSDLASAYLAQTDLQAHEQAFALLTSAAAQGHANASLNLGLMYWNGDGTARDRPLAIRHFRAAWKGGNPRAPFMLGQYYFSQTFDSERRQVRQAPGVQALYWLSLAYKADPNPQNRTQALKLAQNLDALAPWLNDALNVWLKTSDEPPPLTE